MKYKGVEYENCIVNEDGQEWCYIDHMGFSWDKCARGNFKIDYNFLFKNINSKNKEDYCLFVGPNNKIFSVKCDIFIKIKQNKINSLTIDNFLWYWINGSQIKTKNGLCIHPVKTPIVSKLKNKIEYFGFIETKTCDINDDLSLNIEQKWKLDENGRVINEFDKKCLVRSDQGVDIARYYKVFETLEDKFEVYTVYLGDCIGNLVGYKGKENWVLDEFKPESIELLALNKLIGLYNNGNNKMNSIIRYSKDNNLKIIKFQTELLNYKQDMVNLESNLEKLEKKIVNTKLDDNLLFKQDIHNNKGLLLEIYEKINNDDYKFISKAIIDGPNIKNNIIQVIDLYDRLNNGNELVSKAVNLDNSNFLLKINGFLIDFNGKKFRFKIETNAVFRIIYNSKIIIENASEFSENRIIFSDYIIKSDSLNEITIYLEDKKARSNYFTLNFHVDDENIISSGKQFIPIIPKKSLEFKISELNYFFKPKMIDCQTNLNGTNNLSQNIICPSFCNYSKNSSICGKAQQEGIIPRIGGLLKLDATKNLVKMENKFLGLLFFMTEIKLGYYEDIKKNFLSFENLNHQNFIFKLKNSREMADKSFIFYKNQFVEENQYVIYDIKLVCDNSKAINPFNKEDNVKFKIDKLHDMVNGFSLWIKKIKVSDLIKNGFYVEDVNLRFFDINYSQKSQILDIEFKNYLYTLDSNKFVCKINKNIIMLEIKKSSIQNKYNSTDFHSTCENNFQDLFKFYHKFKTNQLYVRCTDSCDYSKIKKLNSLNDNNFVKNDLICLSAQNLGFISKNGGILIIERIKDINEDFVVFDKFHLKPLTLSPIIKQNNYGRMIPIYKNQVNDKENFKFFKGLMKKKAYSSFLQLKSSSKFYSNDLLLKIENVLNEDTEKIINESKKISEVNNINKELETKIRKIEEGDNSLEVVRSKVEELKKLEKNIQSLIDSKFEKYRKMMLEKDAKILDISSKTPIFTNNEYKLNKLFFDDWIIVDDIDSKDGPSNYVLKEEKGEVLISQISSIYTNSNLNLASSIILKTYKYNNIYGNIVFSSSTSGIINIMFKYKDFNNYISLELKRNNNNEGEINVIKKYFGKMKIIKKLDCSEIMLFFKQCVGFHTNKLNNIEIFNMNKEIVIIFNSNVIFRVKDEDLLDFNLSYFALAITNQNSITLKEILVKELNIEDFVKYQSILHNQPNKLDKKQDNETKEIKKKTNTKETKKEQIVVNKLKYNPVSNKFEPDNPIIQAEIKKTESNSEGKPILEQQKPVKKNVKPIKITFNKKIIPNKHNIDDLISSPFPVKNTELKKIVKEVYKEKIKYSQDQLKQTCLNYDKQEYVCNYISQIIVKNDIDLNHSSVDSLNNIIHKNCIQQMHNEIICNQILLKLKPLLTKIKENINSSINQDNHSDQKILQNFDQVNILLEKCSLDFLPQYLHTRMICLNEVMSKELESRKNAKANDLCIKNFCQICCSINYGNNDCKIHC